MNCPVAALERRAKARAFVLSLLAQKHASKRACPLGWRLQQASGKPENGKSRRAHVLCDFYDLVHCESPTPPLKSDEIATKKKASNVKRTSNFLTLAYLKLQTLALHTNFRQKEIKFSRIFRLLSKKFVKLIGRSALLNQDINKLSRFFFTFFAFC